MHPTTMESSLKRLASPSSSVSSVLTLGLCGEPRKLRTTQRPAATCRSNRPPETVDVLNQGTGSPSVTRLSSVLIPVIKRSPSDYRPLGEPIDVMVNRWLIGGCGRPFLQPVYPQTGLLLGKAVVAVEVAYRDVSGRRNDPAPQADAGALHLIENVTHEGVFDAHSQRPTAEYQLKDLAVGDDRRTHHSVVAEPVRYVDRQQPGIRISCQRRKFARGKFPAGCVELRRTLKQLLAPIQFCRAGTDALEPAFDLKRFDIFRLVQRLRAKLLPLDLCLDQRRARGRLGGDDRQLQTRIVEQAPPEIEGVLAPHLHFRQPLPDTIAFDRVVIDEQECVERKAQLLRYRADIADLVVPIDAPGHEIIRLEQALRWIMIGILPEFADGGFVILADTGQHDPAPLETQQRFMQAEIESDKGESAADLGSPGKRAAGFGEHSRPQGAVEVENDAFLASDPHHGNQRIDMPFRHDRLAAIGVATQRLHQGSCIRENAVDGGFLAVRPLQHPARRTKMRKRNLPVVEHPFGSDRSESS